MTISIFHCIIFQLSLPYFGFTRYANSWNLWNIFPISSVTKLAAFVNGISWNFSKTIFSMSLEYVKFHQNWWCSFWENAWQETHGLLDLLLGWLIKTWYFFIDTNKIKQTQCFLNGNLDKFIEDTIYYDWKKEIRKL